MLLFSPRKTFVGFAAFLALSFSMQSCAPALDNDTLFANNFSSDVFMEGELYVLVSRSASAVPNPVDADADADVVPIPTVPPLESEVKTIAIRRMLETGMTAYNIKNYTDAIANFKSFLEVDADNKNNNEVKFYLAVCYLATSETETAKAIFKELIKNDKKHSFREESEWYLALTLLKSKETNEAKKILKDIANSKKMHPFADKAKNILSKIS
jgi:TolA-binding protein